LSVVEASAASLETARTLAAVTTAAAETRLEAVLDVLSDGFVALTGAGISTDSGIPDYRGPGSAARMPMTYEDFLSGPAARQRYWARSHIGWSRMKRAVPNAGHQALAALEARGLVRLLVTQNVDGLHEAAGSGNICALHGRIADVICLSCRTTSSRAALHASLEALNPAWLTDHATVEVRPDGDVALDETAGFVVPACSCGGVLKPDVVFFGENVPKERVLRCYAAVEQAPALLVLGSSLTVMSGLRFVKAAAKRGTPVVIVNKGETRGDPLATYKLESGTSEFLLALAPNQGLGTKPSAYRTAEPTTTA
jgi:NAD-dependent SIR2 family protein deacetylase